MEKNTAVKNSEKWPNEWALVLGRHKQELELKDVEISSLKNDLQSACSIYADLHEDLEYLDKCQNGLEKVSHPDHYQSNNMEVIEVIESFHLNFSLGNAIKYILRAGKKGDTKEDLQKAIWYLKREIGYE